jgi:hypothetical protein
MKIFHLFRSTMMRSIVILFTYVHTLYTVHTGLSRTPDNLLYID